MPFMGIEVTFQKVADEWLTPMPGPIRRMHLLVIPAVGDFVHRVYAPDPNSEQFLSGRVVEVQWSEGASKEFGAWVYLLDDPK